MRLQKSSDGRAWSLPRAALFLTRLDIEVVENTEADGFVHCVTLNRQGQADSSKHPWTTWKLWHKMVLTPKEEVEA